MRVGAKREGTVDHRLDGGAVHDAMVRRLAVLRDIGVKAVAAPHVAGGTCRLDEKRDVLHGVLVGELSVFCR